MIQSISEKKNTFQLSVVSTEATLFIGEVTFMSATGMLGELGIAPGHTPLITTLKPGQLRVTLPNGSDDVFYISGGTLEVQAHSATVLADTAIRADELDEAAANEAKRQAEQALADQKDDLNYSNTLAELAKAAAQLQAIEQIRRLRKHR